MLLKKETKQKIFPIFFAVPKYKKAVTGNRIWKSINTVISNFI